MTRICPYELQIARGEHHFRGSAIPIIAGLDTQGVIGMQGQSADKGADTSRARRSAVKIVERRRDLLTRRAMKPSQRTSTKKPPRVCGAAPDFGSCGLDYVGPSVPVNVPTEPLKAMWLFWNVISVELAVAETERPLLPTIVQAETRVAADPFE
jgi:hypothetical protein